MDIKKKITPQLVGEIVAMLIKEEYFDELQNHQFYLREENGKYEVYLGTKKDDYEYGKKYFSEQFKQELYGVMIPDFISKSNVEENLEYVLSIDRQIIEQAGWIDREDMPITLLGNYNSRGGIKQGDITVILNFMDLYDVYKNGVKIAEDIYCDELYYAVRERLI